MTQSEVPAVGAARVPRTTAIVALVLAIAAILAPVFYVAFFPFLVFGVIAAGVALVLILRARAHGHRGPIVGWTVAIAVLGAFVDVVLLIIALVLLAGPRLDHVEVQAVGQPGFTVEFADDTQAYSVEWPGGPWFQRWTTTTGSAEVTVIAADGVADSTVSCTILWNEVIVVEETSDGRVTCHYDAR